jgi:hypothetical protein
MGFFSRLLGGAKPPAKWEPSVIAHTACGGAIRVLEVPRGSGWEYAEDERQGDGFTVLVLKYILPATPAPLALLAKIYANDEDRPPPGDPAATDWRQIFRPLLSEISSVTTLATRQLTMTKALPAWEAVLDGLGADSGAPLRIRERRAVVDRELFIVTAMGAPALFEAHAADIDRWFDSAAFVPIGDAPAR